MKRLTQKDEQGSWCLKGVSWEQLHEGQVITKPLWERLYGALWKLMEYEDTGLAPEDVERVNDFEKTQVAHLLKQLNEEQCKHRWIPVEERLPEKAGEYLVTFAVDEKVRLVGYGCCRKDVLGNNIGFGWYDLYSGMYFADKAFVAWMLLPEPYKPEEV